MVQEEGRILRRREEVEHDTAHAVMTAAVKTTVGGANILAVHQGLDVFDGCCRQHLINERLVVVGRNAVVVQIAVHAAGVGDVPRSWQAGEDEIEAERPEIDRSVGERTGGDASSTASVRELLADADDVRASILVQSIATERVRAAVEERARLKSRVLGPVPVGQTERLGIAALVVKCLFHQVEEVTVPAEENAADVNAGREIDVDACKVAEPRRTGGNEALLELGGLLHEAFHAIDVAQLLRVAHRAPFLPLDCIARCALGSARRRRRGGEWHKQRGEERRCLHGPDRCC